MLVVNHDCLDRLDGDVNDVSDAFEALVRLILSSCSFKIEPQVLNGPFTTVYLTIVLSALLNGKIGQMDHHIVQLGDIRRVLLGAEPRESP